MARRFVLPAIVHGLVAVALTWPLVTNLSGLVVGGPRTDVWNSLWGLWFVHQVGGPWPVQTALLDHPSGGSIVVADPLNALLGLPLLGTLGPPATYGLLALLHLTFGGLAANLLGRSTGGSGWIAGIGYQLAPVCISFFHNGSSEAIATGWLPLACWAVIRAVERGSWGRSLGAGAALAVCALGGWYAGVGSWIFVSGVLVVGWAGVGWKDRVRRLLPGMALALAVVLPTARAVRAVALSADGLVDIKQEADLARIRRTLGAADPRTFVMPGDFRSPDFAHLEGNPGDFVHTAYLGWVLLVLAVVASRRRDGHQGAWWWAIGGGLVLAMGPLLVIDGKPFGVGARGVGLPLPYLALEGLPGFSSLSLLYRLAAVSALGLAVLADRLRWWWVLPVVAEVLLLSPVRGLPAITEVYDGAALKAITDEGAVLDLPPTASRTYLFEQTIHDHPRVGSLNAGINLAGLEVAKAARDAREGKVPPEHVAEVARQQGVRWVVVHKDVLMDAAWVETAGAFRRYAEPVAEDARVRVFRLY